MTSPYDDDLAFVQAQGFGELALAAAAFLIPQLRARGARRIVDLGCGAGVSTKAFVKAGFDTLAIEPSAALLALAREACPAARFQQASAYDVNWEPCDAILALGEALSYHPPSEDAEARLQRFFHDAHQALASGGLLVFDLIETGEPALNARAWKAGPDWAVLSASHEDAVKSRLTREIETFRDLGSGEYRRRKETHHVRLFARDAVTSWLGQAGFTVETATTYGGFQLAPRRVAFHAVRA